MQVPQGTDAGRVQITLHNLCTLLHFLHETGALHRYIMAIGSLDKTYTQNTTY
jgi:hypothetical protein